MDKKLTLSLKENVIEKAKKYAKANKVSLSKMIEAYFDSLTNEINNTADIEITPLVESLGGIIELPSDFDYKKSKAKSLVDKYK